MRKLFSVLFIFCCTAIQSQEVTFEASSYTPIVFRYDSVYHIAENFTGSPFSNTLKVKTLIVISEERKFVAKNIVTESPEKNGVLYLRANLNIPGIKVKVKTGETFLVTEIQNVDIIINKKEGIVAFLYTSDDFVYKKENKIKKEKEIKT